MVIRVQSGTWQNQVYRKLFCCRTCVATWSCRHAQKFHSMPRHLPTTVEKTIQKAHRQSHQIQQIALCSTPKQRIETIAEKNIRTNFGCRTIVSQMRSSSKTVWLPLTILFAQGVFFSFILGHFESWFEGGPFSHNLVQARSGWTVKFQRPFLSQCHCIWIFHDFHVYLGSSPPLLGAAGSTDTALLGAFASVPWFHHQSFGKRCSDILFGWSRCQLGWRVALGYCCSFNTIIHTSFHPVVIVAPFAHLEAKQPCYTDPQTRPACSVIFL